MRLTYVQIYIFCIYLNVTQSVEKGCPVIEQELDAGQGRKTYILSAFNLSNKDSLFLFGYFREKKNMYLSLYNIANKQIDTLGYLYNDKIEFADASAAYVYNSKHNYMVLGQLFFNQIYFYSLTDFTKSFSVSLEKNPVDYNNIKSLEYHQREQYYTLSFATDEFFGFLYSQKSGQSEIRYFVQLLDWNGNIIKIVELDTRHLQLFLMKKAKYYTGWMLIMRRFISGILGIFNLSTSFS